MNDKCQIFTPSIYVKQMLDCIDYKGPHILGKHILENSCGEGNILVEVVKRYIEASKELNYSEETIKEDLETYILGFEIDNKVKEICIRKLNEEALKYGIVNVRWNIKNEDYLKYNFEKKIEYIVGNPPYIMYQQISIENREFLKMNFSSCAKGKFDYCYAFIEKSIFELSDTGKMSYLIPNSIFKNVFGENLRNLMRDSIHAIYDFKESSIFGNGILTSPAIICLNNNKKNLSLNYYDVDNERELLIDKSLLHNKWLFSNNEIVSTSLSKKKFGDYFKVANSVATLLNRVYVIQKKDILSEDENYIEIQNFYIEKNVLRSAASPMSYSINREEYIIFPYKYVGSSIEKYEEEEFKLTFPGAYKYLLSFSKELNERKSDKSAKWFEYGRSQALLYLNQEKILLSSIMTNEIKSYQLNEKAIPYSGFYIVPLGEKKLSEAEDILKSDEFYIYMSVRGINANGKSLRFSVNDILNFPMK